MDDLRFYVLFNSFSVISGHWAADNERLFATETRLEEITILPLAVYVFLIAGYMGNIVLDDLN